jgi:hypothetical protein
MADSNSAFATVQPLQANVSDFINNQERMDFAYRDEERKVNEMKRAAQEREGAKKDALLKEFQSAKQVTPSGITSIDSFDYTIMNIALEDRVKLYKKKVAGGLSVDEEIMYAKLGNMAGTLELMGKAYSEEKENYYKQLKEGKVKRDVNYEMKMQEMDKSAIPFIDSEGNPAIGIDNDGDGKPDVITFSLGEGLSLKPSYVPNIDFTSSFQAFGEKLGSKETGTDVNFTKTTIKETPIELAKLTARGALYGKDGSYSDLAKSQLYDMGIRDFNDVPESVLNEMKNSAVQTMMATRDRSKVVDVDNSSINTANKNAKDNKDNTPFIGTPVVATKEKWGISFDTLDPDYLSVPMSGKPVVLNAIPYNVKSRSSDGTVTTARKVLSNAKVENYTYNNKGKLVLDVSYSTGKVTERTTNDDGSTSVGFEEKGTMQVAVTDETETRFAKESGKTVEQLRASARKLKTEEENTQTSGTVQGGSVR